MTYALARRFPNVLERIRSWPRIMGLVFAGPILVALGRRRLGAALSFGSAAAFADIARSQVVPAPTTTSAASPRSSRSAEPCAPIRPTTFGVILLSAGAEESFEEGSQAFLRRHATNSRGRRT